MAGVKLLFATRNRGKIRELEALVAPLGFTVVSLADYDVPSVEEDAPTFAGNAEKKARAALAATGVATLADDSGLEVDALGGAPGVRSARFSGDHDDAANNAALLAALAGVPDAQRTARFRCVLALVDSAAPPRFAEGICTGRIAHAPRGENGFGYDPLFVVDGMDGRTMAELAPGEKNAISHRGRALRALFDACRAR